MGLAELLLLAVGLAMDAFAVSVCGSMVLTPDNRCAEHYASAAGSEPFSF